VYVVSVDSARCQGHARCLAFAPEVFDFDDEGYSFVPEEKSRFERLDEGVQRAIANCPERAIIVTEEPSA
jgi:ferredoxin